MSHSRHMMASQPPERANSPYSRFRKLPSEIESETDDNHHALIILGHDGIELVEDEFGGLMRMIIVRNDVSLLKQYLPLSPYAVWPMVPHHWDVFFVAARHGSIDVLQILLEHHSNSPVPIEAVEERGFRLLNLACESAQIDMVRWLFNNQPTYANIHAKQHKRTAILSAAGTEHNKFPYKRPPENEEQARLETMLFLLEKGANASDVERWPPGSVKQQVPQPRDTVLSLAISWAGRDLIKKLVELGADVHIKMMQDANYEVFCSQDTSLVWDITPLFIACLYSNVDGIQVSFELKDKSIEIADMVSLSDSAGRIPIHWAAFATVYIDAGGEFTASQNDTQKIIDTIKMVLSENPKTVNVQDKEGNTALHYAAGYDGRLGKAGTDIVKLLCENGADASLRNEKKETPLHRWCRRQCGNLPADEGSATVLLAYGSRVTDVDKDGNTPLHLVAKCWLHLADIGRNLTAADQIKAQDRMMEILMEAGDDELLDQPNSVGKTPRQLREEARGRLRDFEHNMNNPRPHLGRGRGRGRGQVQGQGRGGVNAGMGRGMGRGRAADK